MKLHLPNGLRKAVLTCLASVAWVSSHTASAVITTGACFVAWSQLAMATPMAGSDVTLNSETIANAADRNLEFLEVSQTATVSGAALDVGTITVGNSTTLRLQAEDSTSRLTLGNLNLGASGRLEIYGDDAQMMNFLNLSQVAITAGSGARIIANFATGNSNIQLNQFLNTAYTGEFEIVRGTFLAKADDDFGFSKIIVSGSDGK